MLSNYNFKLNNSFASAKVLLGSIVSHCAGKWAPKGPADGGNRA